MKLPNPVPDRGIQENFDALTKHLEVPRFRVYRTAALSVTSGTIILWDTEDKDTHNWYDPTTGRFTPQRAGAYRFSWAMRANVALTTDAFIVAYGAKNGSTTHAGTISHQRPGTAAGSVGSAQVELNGTTDYMSVIVQHNNGGSLALQVSNNIFQWFDGEYIGP